MNNNPLAVRNARDTNEKIYPDAPISSRYDIFSEGEYFYYISNYKTPSLHVCKHFKIHLLSFLKNSLQEQTVR